ncbi:MAG TPA: MBL fold metallo-hydrolase [Aggregatilineales bacterium]|nr:MBL fold metallo-hydrolase [Aggregatilineales bacterium]
MEITWYGHSCFRLAERGQVMVITDPYSDDIGLPPLRVKGDAVVTISHNQPGHNNLEVVKNPLYTLTGPGEYEIGGTFISGIDMSLGAADVAHRNIAYVVRYGDLTVLHLGDLMHVPDQSTIEALGEVTVALVPVGGGNSLKAAMAAEVISLIEPFYIVPMHYELPGLRFPLESVEKFLKEMGVSKLQEEDSLKVLATSLPEQPQVVVLRPQI